MTTQEFARLNDHDMNILRSENRAYINGCESIVKLFGAFLIVVVIITIVTVTL